MIAKFCAWPGMLIMVSACAAPDCATSHSTLLEAEADRPARFAAPAVKQLQVTVERAMGVPVMLANDSLLNTSRLIIERKPHRQLETGLVMGTDLSGPIEQFTLMRNGDQCLLVKHSDNSRWPINEVQCVVE